MFLIKSFLIGQKARVIAFTVSELLKKTQQEIGGGAIKLSHPRPSLLRLNIFCKEYNLFKDRSTLVFS